MAINLKSTSDAHVNGVKTLVYGQSGAGKTTLIGTMPSPIILSAEGGLLALSDMTLPYIEISSIDELKEAYSWLTDSAEAKEFQSVALDSISEIAEVVLNTERKKTKDPRQAYGELQIAATEIIRAFRDLPGKNVLFTAKLEKSQDEMGRMLYGPSMPGTKLSQQLPFFFDEVLALRIERDAEGVMQRALMTEGDATWIAKDRSGKLLPWEEPNLQSIINKISGSKS